MLLTVGILQYKPIQSAKYCNLIGQLRATELDYIVKCPQCLFHACHALIFTSIMIFPIYMLRTLGLSEPCHAS